MIFEELNDFKRDVKKLLKKYRTIQDDLLIIKKILKVNPNERPPSSYRINNLGIDTCIIKVERIASKSLKGKGRNTGFRLIYAYYEKEEKIVLIELYHKSEKDLKDRKKIIDNFSKYI